MQSRTFGERHSDDQLTLNSSRSTIPAYLEGSIYTASEPSLSTGGHCPGGESLCLESELSLLSPSEVLPVHFSGTHKISLSCLSYSLRKLSQIPPLSSFHWGLPLPTLGDLSQTIPLWSPRGTQVLCGGWLWLKGPGNFCSGYLLGMKEGKVFTIMRTKTQINISVNDHKYTSITSFTLLNKDLRWIVWIEFHFIFSKRSICFVSKPRHWQKTYTADHMLWPRSHHQMHEGLPSCWLGCFKSQINSLKMNRWQWPHSVKTVPKEGEQRKENTPNPTLCPLTPHILSYIWKIFCLSFLLFLGYSCLF